MSPAAFAGMSGAVSCNTDDGRLVALYSWFHSDADSYSTLNVFVQEADGDKFKQSDGNNDDALKAISVKTAGGAVITVSPDMQNSVCLIKMK